MLVLCLTLVLILLPNIILASSDNFFWVGGVSDTSALFKISGYKGNTFIVSRQSDDITIAALTITESYSSLKLSNLTALTTYTYGFGSNKGKFRSFPTEGVETPLKFAFGSCAYDITTSVYSDIKDHEPDLVIITGDLFYGDITENKESLYNDWYKRVLNQPSAISLFHSAPIAYIWDDHDFGENDAQGNSKSRDAACSSFRKNVPHYNLSSSIQSVYQAFTYGTYRFILTDMHSESSNTVVFSNEQKEWFFDELIHANNYSTVFWVSSAPWIGDYENGGGWLGHINERNEIANIIAKNNVTNLIMLSGDAHMLAIDNGINSNYATLDEQLYPNGGGFPVFQGGPLSNTGSVKGGPFSHYCYGYLFHWNDQYGIVTISPSITNVNSTSVSLDGYLLGDVNNAIVSLLLDTPFLPSSGHVGEGECQLAWFPYWVWLLFISSSLSYILIIICIIIFENNEDLHPLFHLPYANNRWKRLSWMFIFLLISCLCAYIYADHILEYRKVIGYPSIVFIVLFLEMFMFSIVIVYRMRTRNESYSPNVVVKNSSESSLGSRQEEIKLDFNDRIFEDE